MIYLQHVHSAVSRASDCHLATSSQFPFYQNLLAQRNSSRRLHAFSRNTVDRNQGKTEFLTRADGRSAPPVIIFNLQLSCIEHHGCRDWQDGGFPGRKANPIKVLPVQRVNMSLTLRQVSFNGKLGNDSPATTIPNGKASIVPQFHGNFRIPIAVTVAENAISGDKKSTLCENGRKK